MYFGQDIEKILPGDVAIGGANMGMVPLFAVMWCPSRSSVWAGYVPADGQELSKALYPAADAGIQAGNVPAAVEATWQSTPTERGKYVVTSSDGKFRLPDLNGVSVGTLGAVFLRGDGVNSSGTDGVIQPSENKSHTHNIATSTTTAAGAYDGVSARTTGEGPEVIRATSVKASGGDEARPLNVTGCWVIKLFGSVTNAGSADAAQLATDFASLHAEFQANPTPLLSLLARSTPTAVTLGGLITITNTLEAPPKIVKHYLKCVSDELGWVVNDEVQIMNGYDSYGAGGFVVVNQTDSVIEVRCGSTRLPYIPNKTTGVSAALTLARWQYFMEYMV